MALDDKILKLVEKKFGRKAETDNDCYELIAQIKKASGEELGLNTVKRLLGIISGTDNPRTVTRNIVALYLGFDSWNLLNESLNDNDPASSFGDEDGIVYSADLKSGSIVSFNFGNGKDIVLRYLGDLQFLVISVTNSKICENDLLEISRIVEHGKFLADKVIRNGEALGKYYSDHKVMSLKVSEPDSLS